MEEVKNNDDINSEENISTEQEILMTKKMNQFTPLPSSKVDMIYFNRDFIGKKRVTDYRELDLTNLKPIFFYWINVESTDDPQLLKIFEKRLRIHPLIIDDIKNKELRPKYEQDQQQNYMIVVLKMLRYNEEQRIVEHEQVSIIVGKNFVVTFQDDKEGDSFDPIRKELQKKGNKIRNEGVGRLFYAILDAIVDDYIISLEKIGDQLAELEDDIIEKEAEKNPIKELHTFRKELKLMQKMISPLREVTSILYRESEKTALDKYMQDLHEHVLQSLETIDAMLDNTKNLMDMYMSFLGNKTNEVMKFLTIFSSIFLPLSFIAGVYGMNFEMFPEIKWSFGYPLVWTVMLGIASTLYFYFKKRKWI